MTKTVAVIGAGPAGLVSLRQLLKHPDHFSPVVFEKSRQVGGVWNYSDCTETDERGLPCDANLHKSLRTNLPKEIINFSELNFDEDLPSFPHHTEVKKYLERYAETFDLHKYIKFETMLTHVKPVDFMADETKWLITSRNLVNNEIQTAHYDAIIICNGKEAVGNLPELPGKKKFKGQMLHSKNYREAGQFKDKTVLVLGASYSAGDLVFDLAPSVTKLYVAHHGDRLQYELPPNVEDVPPVSSLLPNGVLLNNGECREVDVIIFATGYKYNLPFLGEDCGISLQQERIQPLYRHIFNISHPTMCFVGFLKLVSTFRVAEMQAEYVAAVLRGDAVLPNKSEMIREEEEDYQKRVVAKQARPYMAHSLSPDSQQFQLWDRISTENGITSYKPYVKKIFNRMLNVWVHEYHNFRNKTFRIVGKEDFEEIN